MPKVITEIELPDGTFLALHGHTAQQAAAVIAEELGGKVTSNGSPRFKGAVKPKAEKPSLRPAGLVHASQLEQSLTVQNSEAEFVTNVEPLSLPSLMDEQQKRVVHPAGLVAGPDMNQAPTVNENEDDAEARAEYEHTLARLSGPTFNESVEALALPEMKFDQPAFMKREYADDSPNVEPLELPERVLS